MEQIPAPLISTPLEEDKKTLEEHGVTNIYEWENGLAGEVDNYKLTFGKYKGKTLKEVQEEKPDYIDWLLDNSKDERMKKLIELATGKIIPSEEEQKEILNKMMELHRLFEETNIDRDKFYKHYKVKSDSEMTLEQLNDAIKILKEKINES